MDILSIGTVDGFDKFQNHPILLIIIICLGSDIILLWNLEFSVLKACSII